MNPQQSSESSSYSHSPSTISQDQTHTSSEPQQNYNLPPKKDNFWWEIIKFTIIAIIIVLPVRLFIAQPFIVNGASMDPTFETNDYLIVNQLSYHFENPQRGQVVIFKYPKDTTKYFIKRIIGLPGEKVELTGTSVIIYNKDNPQGFTLDEPYIASSNQISNNMTVTLGPDQYFVMGDNRKESSDSRAWGTLPRNLIVGTPFLRLFPLSELGVFPGDYKEPK